MPTHEFTFPGGRATITTETGGTEDAPDFCVELGDPDQPGLLIEGPSDRHPVIAIFAAEILRLSGRIVLYEYRNRTEEIDEFLPGIVR